MVVSLHDKTLESASAAAASAAHWQRRWADGLGEIVISKSLALLLASLMAAGCCTGQEPFATKAGREISDVADAYYWARIDRPCKIRLTPDVAVHALLAIAMSTVHRMNDRMVWSLRIAQSDGDGGLSSTRVEDLFDRQAVCGAAYTPVWGDQRATQLEVLVARLAGVGLDPWASCPDDLHATGSGLWGRNGGVHTGLSPLPGGFSDPGVAIATWRDRCRVADLDRALDEGGVLGTLIFNSLRPDSQTEAELLRVLQSSRSWRYDPAVLWHKSVTRDPGAAFFAGDQAQWRAAHAAAKRLLGLNKQLRDAASSKLEHRMLPNGAGFTQSVVRWLENIMPLLAAGAEGQDVDENLARQLDWLFQPPVLLAWYLPKDHALGVEERWEGDFYSARIIIK